MITLGNHLLNPVSLHCSILCSILHDPILTINKIYEAVNINMFDIYLLHVVFDFVLAEAVFPAVQSEQVCESGKMAI